MNTYVKKVFTENRQHLTNNWLDTYKSYYEFDNRVVKIKKISGYNIHMELLDGITLDNLDYIKSLDFKTKRFIIDEVVDIFCNQFKFRNENLRLAHIFAHNDFYLKNLMYHNNKVRLIDPESFTIKTLLRPDLRYGKFFESLATLNHILGEGE